MNPRRWSIAVLLSIAATVAAGCLIQPLPVPTDDTTGSGTSGDSGGGSGGGGTGGGGTTSGRTITLSDESTLAMNLTYHINSGPGKSLILRGGETEQVTAIPSCACFTVDNFTPQQSTQTEGFGLQTCTDGGVQFQNATGPFPGVTVTVSSGPPSERITFDIQNSTGISFSVYPYINGTVAQSQVLAPGNITQVTVDKCVRLRVLFRDPTNFYPDLAFVEFPATTSARYAVTDNAGQIQVQKQAS